MQEHSVLIGGKAGDGIDRAGMVIAFLLNRLGLRHYVYREYPSLIRGGHTFSIIRSASEKISAHRDEVDVVCAMNAESIDLHKSRLKPGSVIVYDSAGSADPELPDGVAAVPLDVAAFLKEAGAPPITSNSCVIGAMARVMGIGWEVVEETFRDHLPKKTDVNLAMARRGFDAAKQVFKVEKTPQAVLPILTGNEALSLGLIEGGLSTYIAYPMTPTSTILHFMAERAAEFGLKVIHPESEIGVIMMALGDSYTGERVAVGTSGGGFCLMSEGFSLAGMAELPVVVVLGQRPGPSTGLPTYSSQTELHFALNAGQGEFLRIVVAPGDLEESFHWAQIALNMAAKHRTPVIILTDKNVAEHAASFDISLCPDVKRYAAPVRNAKSVFKVNGYEHDEAGITIEEADLTVAAQDRRLAKIARAAVDLDEFEQVKTYGNANSKDVVLCWGSNKGVCVETATKLGLKVVQPIVMSPFPSAQFARAVAGSERIFAVESNATGQLTQLINRYGFQVDAAVSKYDGRAFSLGELEEKLSGAFAKGGD